MDEIKSAARVKRSDQLPRWQDHEFANLVDGDGHQKGGDWSERLECAQEKIETIAGAVDKIRRAAAVQLPLIGKFEKWGSSADELALKRQAHAAVDEMIEAHISGIRVNEVWAVKRAEVEVVRQEEYAEMVRTAARDCDGGPEYDRGEINCCAEVHRVVAADIIAVLRAKHGSAFKLEQPLSLYEMGQRMAGSGMDNASIEELAAYEDALTERIRNGELDEFAVEHTQQHRQQVTDRLEWKRLQEEDAKSVAISERKQS